MPEDERRRTAYHESGYALLGMLEPGAPVGCLHGNFRPVYAGSSLQACLLEVLVGFRRDARLAVKYAF